MTHESKGPGDGTPEPAAPQQSPQGAPTGEEAASASQQVSEIDALRAEVAELKDRVLRTHAEMDNMRKRLEKERSDASKYAISKFARDIVNVGDNFRRVIDMVPAATTEEVPALKSFLEGVTMTEREFISVLERHGIKRLDPKGQPFNPHHHQAVMEQPNPDVPSGTVTQVFQAGYLIEDRILRPAMVVVAKGGLKPAKSPEAQPGDPAAEAAPPTDGGGNGDQANSQS